MTGPTISRYETGNSQIKANDLPRFARVFGIHPGAFYEDVQPGTVRERVADYLAQSWPELSEAEQQFIEGQVPLLRRYREQVRST